MRSTHSFLWWESLGSSWTMPGVSSASCLRTGWHEFDKLGESAHGAGEKAKEGGDIFARFAEEAKSYAVGFLTFEAAKHAIEGIVETLVEAEYSQARLNAVLKATGGQAGMTA